MSALFFIMQVLQFVLCPAVHDFKHGILLIPPAGTITGIEHFSCEWMLDGVDHALMGGCTGSKSVISSPKGSIIVWIFIFCIHLSSTGQFVGVPFWLLAVNQNVLYLVHDAFGIVAGRVGALPCNVRRIAACAKDFIAD